MKKVIAATLALTLILSVASCSNKTEPDDTGSDTTETATETTTVTTETSGTTETTDDWEYGPERVTEAPDYGDGQIADICELMKSVTGKRIALGMALVEDYFEQSFEEEFKLKYDYSNANLTADMEHDGQYFYEYTMKVKSGDLSFNKFRFITNQEIGNVYMVEFKCTASEFDYSVEELRDYYLKIENELTKFFGAPADSSNAVGNAPYSYKYSEFKASDDLTFLVEFECETDRTEIRILCTNKAEKGHFILGYEAEQNTPETTSDMYYKEPKEGDVVRDGKTGITYVKNQLLISCTMGTPNDKEKVQKICDEIGAEIVGYIEITSDFQIEFKRDMTYDELMNIANELTEKYYFIESVALNHAVPYGPDDNGLD